MRFEWRYLPPALGVLALGLGVLAYTGPGRVLVRGALGDVLVVIFMHFSLGTLWPAPLWRRAAFVGVFSFTIEGIQALGVVSPQDPMWSQLIFGSTFDPLDLVAYTLGLAMAVFIDWKWLAARAPEPPSS